MDFRDSLFAERDQCRLALAQAELSNNTATDARELAAREAFFESKVRPVLVKSCLKCHGAEKQEGGLRLDSLDAMLKGGDSGPAVMPQAVADSLIVSAVRNEGLEMPPSGPLPIEEQEAFAQWVEQGAVWPVHDGAELELRNKSGITEEDKRYWAFQPLRRPTVPVAASVEQKNSDGSGEPSYASRATERKNADGSGEPSYAGRATEQKNTDGSGEPSYAGRLPVPQAINNDAAHAIRTPIDAFLQEQLVASKLCFAPPADSRTLMRRVYFDLVGVPPTVAERVSTWQRQINRGHTNNWLNACSMILAMAKSGRVTGWT